MKKEFYFFIISLIIYLPFTYAENDPFKVNNEKSDFVFNSQYSDSLRELIANVIKEVNERSSSIDLIHSEGEVYVKSKTIDQNGKIEIKAKKPDDFWFRIWGSFAIISKDAFIAHFGRQNFVYFDNLKDKVIEGPSTDDNIGYITRIKCSFDDMMNALTGTVRITSNRDTIAYSDDDDYYMLTLKSGKIRKFWIRKSDYRVDKYVYLNRKMLATLTIAFSNFNLNSNGQYAKKIEITKGSIYIKYTIKDISFQQTNLNFNVDFPSGVRRVRW